MDILARINEVWPQLHAMPEPAFCEVKTSEFLAARLSKIGYEVQTKIGDTTALTAVLDSGKPGPTVALRTDMDCLLFKQEDGSQKPIHACGHDGHMSTVLAVAELLKEQGLPCGRVKLLCQPAEEIGSGALKMLEAGALEDVDYVLGFHVLPNSMVKKGQIIAQINWTACTLIQAEIIGLAAHGSQPHLGINAINAGAAIVNAINALAVNPLLGGSVKTTRFLGGSGSLNAICDKVEMGFDLRSTSNPEMLELREKVKNLIADTAKAYGCTATSKIIGTCPAAEADPSILKLTSEVITEELGPNGLIPSMSLTIGEDFNFFKQEKPQLKTASLGIGCDLEPRLHDPNMTYDINALEGAIKVFAKLMRRILVERP